jgi:hypothetical protein
LEPDLGRFFFFAGAASRPASIRGLVSPDANGAMMSDASSFIARF